LAGYNSAIRGIYGNKETLRIRFTDVELWFAVIAVSVFALLTFFGTVLGLVPLKTR